MTKRNTLVWRIVVVATILLMALLLFSHTYNDIVITTRHGMNFWDILLSGNVLDFYELNITVSGNPNFPALQSCAYNMLLYIVFAIWNIPLVLLEKFAGIDVMNNIFCLVYAKCLVVVVILFSAYLVERLLKLLDVSKQNSQFFVYLYLTSALMVSVGLIISQYDILSVVFQLLGLKAFLQKKDWQFVLWFGIATCFKYFALIMFVPLMVLRYKKVFIWLIGLIAVCIPTVLTKLPFVLGASGASPGTGLMLDLLKMMLGYSRSELNLFVIAYIFCVVWCFMQKDQDDIKVFNQKAVWIVFVAYTSFFVFLSVYPYWVILMAPYIVLVLALAQNNIYANLLLETCGMAALVVADMLRYSWCYFGKTMKSMLLSYVIGPVPDSNGYIYTLIQALNNANFFPVFNAVFIACMGALAYLTYPKEKTLVQEKALLCNQCMDLVVLRCGVTMLICLLPILSVFI